MIRKLKRKFILLAMTAVCVLLAVVVAGMNLISYNALVAEADATLDILSSNRGSFPDTKIDRPNRFPMPMSPETPYESRYFSVLFGADGQLILTDTGKIAAIDPAAAADYGTRALESGRQSGFLGDYRYLRSVENGHDRIVFLDCGRKLQSFHTFLYASLGMAAAGIVAVFFVILFCSGRIIRPIAQSYEKQRQFITDAGHELKTPLTIIGANVDLLEMDQPEAAEALADIRQQTRRLTALTNDLVLLARMEEAESTMPLIDFPVSEVVLEAASAFRAPALAQSKDIALCIQPNLTLRGNARAITQLVGLLMDNALKYSPPESNVGIRLQRSGKILLLCVDNPTLDALSPQTLQHVFDRFYRADASRSSQTGGYGIGLSVAKAIVTAHGGKIQATAENAHTFRITVSFPL